MRSELRNRVDTNHVYSGIINMSQKPFLTFQETLLKVLSADSKVWAIYIMVARTWRKMRKGIGRLSPIPSSFWSLQPEACHKLQASGNMATTWKYFTGLLTGKIPVTCSCYSGVHKDRLNCILIRSLCVFYEIIRGPYVILSTPSVRCFLGFFIVVSRR